MSSVYLRAATKKSFRVGGSWLRANFWFSVSFHAEIVLNNFNDQMYHFNAVITLGFDKADLAFLKRRRVDDAPPLRPELVPSVSPLHQTHM